MRACCVLSTSAPYGPGLSWKREAEIPDFLPEYEEISMRCQLQEHSRVGSVTFSEAGVMDLSMATLGYPFNRSGPKQ